MTKLLDTHAPVQQKTVSVVDTAPWFDSEYRAIRKLRRQAERIKDRSCEHHIRYKDLCSKATLVAQKKKTLYLTSVLNKSLNQPRNLYQIVNKIMDRKQENALPDYTDDMQDLATDFNQFFLNKIDKIRSKMTPIHDGTSAENNNFAPLF